MTSVEFPGGGPLPTSDVRPVGTTFYLTSGVAQGQIASRHWRLSDVLNTMQQQFLLLRDGLMEQGSLPREETAVSATEIVIHLDSIILAVEARTAGMERPASSAALRTPRTVTSVVIDAGPYRIRGQAHVVPGVALLQHILDPNRPFIPITEAVVLFRRSAAGGASDLPGGYDGVVRAPFLLVNRRHLIAVALAGAAPAARSRAEEPAAPPVQEYRRLTPAAAEWSPPPAAAAPWSPPPAAPAPAPAPWSPPPPSEPAWPAAADLRPSMPAWGAAPDVDMSPAAFAPPRYAGEIEPPAPPTPAPTGARPNLGESRDQQLLSSLPTTGFTPADPDAAATLLRNGPIFRGVAEQPFLLMMHKLRRERLLQMRRYADGDEILRQGEDGNTLHFIIAGSVGVERTQPGGVTARLAELGAGELFGEMALLGDGHRTATVRAVGPVETLVILQDGVRQVLSGFPAASRPLLALLRARRAALEGM